MEIPTRHRSNRASFINIADALADIGFRNIVESDNATTTQELISQESPAAILVEWGSSALCRAINPNIKVIYFITPADFAKNQSQIAALGHYYILKPFDSKTLKQKFNQLGIKK